MNQSINIETHGPGVIKLALGFVMLSPLTVLVTGLVAAWLVG
ncbi:MAG: hypothetical protein ACJ8KF_12345 [Chthoniobacterales bacterium]